MASIVDWNSVGGTKSGNGGEKRKINYIKFEADKMYKVRPVGKAVEFYKFFVKTAKGSRSICVDAENLDKAAQKLSAHLGAEVKPQHRFAINVIDREDNQIRILENGKSIFSGFASWAKLNNEKPGGVKGADWMINATGDGLQRRYSVMPINQSPLTDAERKRLKEGNEMYDLDEIYKGVDIDTMIEKVLGGKVDAPGPEAGDDLDLPKAKVAVSSSGDDINF